MSKGEIDLDINQIKKRFAETYGGLQEGIRVFWAPGRVNLIGEHTDYNGGLVFPAALNLGTMVAARPVKDMSISLAATDLDERVNAPLDGLLKYRNIKWGSYQLGVADELQKDGLSLAGCQLLYHDTIPHGGGLSSSAAIEVATCMALIALSKGEEYGEDKYDRTYIAKVCQKAENNFVGVKCGIMDQMASSLGKKNYAVFINCKDLDYRLVPLNLKGYSIIISNTNKKRSLKDSKYNERRDECERGLSILKGYIESISCLGDVSLSEFDKCKHEIKDLVVLKRVEHVICENERVRKSVQALESDHIGEFGRLMIESHESLRRLYEVTGTELDTLVEEALKIDGVIGSRMTGAGFGGCTVSVVNKEHEEKFISEVGKNYYNRVGLKPEFYVCETGDGVKEEITSLG